MEDELNNQQQTPTQESETVLETKPEEIASSPEAPRNDGDTGEQAAEPAGEARKSLMARLYLKWKEKMFGKKQKRLQKIMDLANKRKKITVSDVEKLLIVSDSTATRYLSELVKQGRLARRGQTKAEVYGYLSDSGQTRRE